jgi:hypothetical protein
LSLICAASLSISVGSRVKDKLRRDSREELSRRFLILDLIVFLVENAASQTYVLPNNDKHFRGEILKLEELILREHFPKLPEIFFSD